MSGIKPWYKVITPREDLREGKPLDAAEFAVHLDQVRDGRAREDYQNPERFFQRTYLTKNMKSVAAEVVRRLSGEVTETSAIFNLATQFGGGKTHALTLFYHLAKNGAAASQWHGVHSIVQDARVKEIPGASVAVFVGTEFDIISGRGGDDGTPHRRTPWGEIAYQLGGDAAFSVVAEHDAQKIAPAGDVIEKLLPDTPSLILIDELMNYVSRGRKSGVSDQLYNFLHSLCEVARGRRNVVLVVSIPASELEMTVEDHSDYERFKKVLDRLGKAVIMSSESETSEIIRRRLFEWGGLPADANDTINEYADWTLDHKPQIPGWFPTEHAREEFAATYPFHPMVLSVFERKWQTLPRFQRTRGVLRLLALWVSRAYVEGYKGAHRDALIGLGTAPLDDPFFRAAILEQLGADDRLEGVVTTDICGKGDAHSVRLDQEAVDSIKKARLHRKAATSIFFESNGGQGGGENKAAATVPEVRLAVAEPDIDIGNVETVLESLSTSCYYMSIEQNKYRFGLSPNLNKLLADRRANIKDPEIEKRIREDIQKVFAAGSGVERVYFPSKTSDISDRPVLSLVVLSPDRSMADEKNTVAWVDTATKENGSSARTYKSGLIWSAPSTSADLEEEARKVLAWQAIADEVDAGDLHLEDKQTSQLNQNLKMAERDLRESVWRSYKYLLLLGKDNKIRSIDLGLVHSSAASNIVEFILNRLRQDDEVLQSVSPNFLVRNWPPAFVEWSTKSVRDAFYASPLFPRLQNPDLIKSTIASGVSGGVLAYVGKTTDGRYEPFEFGTGLAASQVEVSEDVFIIAKATAEAYKAGKTSTDSGVGTATKPEVPEEGGNGGSTTPGGSAGTQVTTTGPGSLIDVPASAKAKKMKWSGSVPPQKWTTFYTRVISRFATTDGLKITINVDVEPGDGVSTQRIEETKAALRELGLLDDVETM